MTATEEKQTNPIEAYSSYLQYLLDACDIEVEAKRVASFSILFPFTLGLGMGLFFIRDSPLLFVLIALAPVLLIQVLVYSYLLLTKNRRASATDEMLPDFLIMVSSNIRSGLTPDRALLVSARPEFGPLEREIDRAAKKGMTGKPLTEMLSCISERIDSPLLKNTIRLINEGISSGGNLPELLERTAYDIRTFAAVRQDIAASVSAYQLFILSASVFGAPLLYAVATTLVETVIFIRQKVPTTSTGEMTQFMQGQILISPGTLLLFSIAAVSITSFFSSIAVGVIGKGQRIEGLKYFPFLLVLSLGFMFLVKGALSLLLGGMFVE